ncbi:MAG: hypothetical protein HY569_01665 [Candidatus Magasanikbacteria bacterium]|nr:hypothetical protein [Candidatus Magasanikbacteria bacterium]
MNQLHPNLNPAKWGSLPKDRQILNIASEFTRAKQWLEQDNRQYAGHSLDRVLELVDLTIQDKNCGRGFFHELLRWREQVGVLYVGAQMKTEANLLLRSLLDSLPQTSIIQT